MSQLNEYREWLMDGKRAKVSQLNEYREWLMDGKRANTRTLSEILSTKFAAEYRKYNTLLRQSGYRVNVKLCRKAPGANLYTAIAPFGSQ